MNKALVIINVDLTPPWSDGLKVYARGLVQSIEKINGNQVEVSKLDGDVKGYYEHVHIVSTGSKVVTKLMKNLKDSVIFKHIVTPAVGLAGVVKTNVFYSIAGGLSSRFIKCFSSDFVARSYLMEGEFIIPPSINTTYFTKSNGNARHDSISHILETSQAKFGLANLRDDDEFVLYSGPLSADRLPYGEVLNAMKEAKSKILIIGRNTTNNESDSLSSIIGYARKIGIEDKVAIAIKTLSEEEKINLIRHAQVIIQPFDSRFRKVAVDPPIFPLECMACCKPVITSNAYSLDTVVVNKENGYIIDWKIPEQFCEALNAALDNASVGINARNTILENFSVEAISKKIENMYNAVS